MIKRRRIQLVLGSVGVLLFGSACEYNTPAQPKFGYEVYDLDCSNHLDDDYDGLIDCEDPDCVFTSGNCGQFIPDGPEEQDREDTLEECTDSEDNDANGQFDCGDPSCQGIPEVCCFKETSNQACYDGIDNDGNGFVDCGDFQCRTTQFVTVCRERYDPATAAQFPVCSDGLDNDSDGDVDCADSGCSDAPECGCQAGDPCSGPEDTFDRCTDGLDNDGDDDVDCDDAQCLLPSTIQLFPEIVTYCAEVEEDTLIECSDGEDNDGDFFTDCADFSCFPMNPVTPQEEQLKLYCESVLGPEEDDPTECQDGIDNDNDGFTDCADFSCDDDGGPLSQLCEDILERGPEECSDGIDNDNNGFIDCGDFSCSGSDDPAVQIKCQESVLIVPPWPHPAVTPNDNCSDGLDNDNDGFVDCDDWDCSWNPDVTVCQPPGERVCE